jgi:hypothetical protein
MNSLDFARMSRFGSYTGMPADVFSSALAEIGKQYAFYMFHGAFEGEWGAHFMINSGNWRDSLILNSVPDGTYIAEWIDPASGTLKNSENVHSENGNIRLITPPYSIDIALRIRK